MTVDTTFRTFYNRALLDYSLCANTCTQHKYTGYGVARISRLLTIIGLFYKRAL